MSMGVQSRFRLGWAVLAAAGVAALALDGDLVRSTAPAHRAAAPQPVCPAPGALGNPFRVAERFLATAVERQDLPASYALATTALRHGASCRDWASGRVPFGSFRQIDWSRSAYVLVGRGEGQIVIRVLLYRPHASSAAPAPFLMELRQGQPGWQVGFFERDGAYTASLRALRA